MHFGDTGLNALRQFYRESKVRAVKRDWWDDVKEGFKNFGEEVKETFNCRKKGESCVGVIHCCGTLQCYFENGAGRDIVSSKLRLYEM